jgi:small subunit ribosomal protein S3
MIERDFVNRKKKEFQIQEFIKDNLRGAGISSSKIQRTPLGEKIIISASRPGLIIGSGGSSIKKLTSQLKKEFGLDNPQIEINEVKDDNLIASIVAEKIATALEKYGTMRFKGIGHKAMTDTLASGAKGIEILISGKIPSARAKVWRFYQGYIKKCGDASVTIVDTAYEVANLKSGIVGVKVSIMPPDVILPDHIKLRDIEKPEISEKLPEEKGLEEIKVEVVTKEEAENIEKEISEELKKKEKSPKTKTAEKTEKKIQKKS